MVSRVVGQVVRTQVVRTKVVVRVEIRVEIRVVDTQQQWVWVMIGYQVVRLVRLVRTGQQLVRLIWK